MNFNLNHTLDLLERTPAVVDAMLRGTSPVWHTRKDSPESWSAFEVVGHLIHAEETDWIPRARIILEHGDTRPFEAFDRFAQLERFKDWDLSRLLDRFIELRKINVDIVRGWQLNEARLGLPGRHPALGSVTLRQLFATWTVHDFNHIAQISRAMAKNYVDDVGAWRAYLSILNA